VISGGLASTVALAGSTEAEQFSKAPAPLKLGGDVGRHGISGSRRPAVSVESAPEEMLLPSGD
jgi:hypothetical protein